MTKRMKLQEVHIKLVNLIEEIESSTSEVKEELNQIPNWESFESELNKKKSELVDALIGRE